jgi:hypothetical protein
MIIFGIPILLGTLYLELWIAYLLPRQFGTIFTVTFLMTALLGGWLWALQLPHPRQERKRRDALLAQEVAKHEEALAEKRS